MLQKPEWIRRTIKHSYSGNEDMQFTAHILSDLGLNTVCAEAACPNWHECFSEKTATFMILGTNCSRNCTFCNVNSSQPMPVDPNEPEKIAKAVSELGLQFVVITSVTRDDLDDGGATHFAAVTNAIRNDRSINGNDKVGIELLIPDLQGNTEALNTIITAEPDVISHNMETVKRLYEEVRPKADYETSLGIIGKVSETDNISSKSGIMLGLGEKEEEVIELLDDLRTVNCRFLTIGQYLRPSIAHHEVIDYVHPQKFEEYKVIALDKGFDFVMSAPFVRSSYRAAEQPAHKY